MFKCILVKRSKQHWGSKLIPVFVSYSVLITRGTTLPICNGRASLYIVIEGSSIQIPTFAQKKARLNYNHLLTKIKKTKHNIKNEKILRLRLLKCRFVQNTLLLSKCDLHSGLWNGELQNGMKEIWNKYIGSDYLNHRYEFGDQAHWSDLEQSQQWGRYLVVRRN